MVRKQLKKEFPNTKQLDRKAKRNTAKKVLEEVVDEYDFSETITPSKAELLGIEQQSSIKGRYCFHFFAPFEFKGFALLFLKTGLCGILPSNLTATC